MSTIIPFFTKNRIVAIDVKPGADLPWVHWIQVNPVIFGKKLPIFFFEIKNIFDIRYILYVCKSKHERSMCPGFVCLQRCAQV